MSTQCSGGPAALEKAEVHAESIQQVQPIDLAPRSGGGQLMQLRPVAPFGTRHVTGKSVGGGGGLVNAPIISVNRPANITLLPPARSTAGQPVGTQVTQPISGTYQIARVQGMRSATMPPGQQPASITVTPISASNFGPGLRLTSATVNNGSWIQPGQPTFGGNLRPATITVGARSVRPDTAKMIHLQPGAQVQHVTQLQVVDPKGSLLKPSITSTPLLNIRAPLQGGSSTVPQGMITPFTIKTTNLTNIPSISRPQTSTPNQVQKVLSQPPHGTPIQFVNKSVMAITSPLPRLSVNTVNLLSTNANLAPNSSSPVVAVTSRQGATLMTSSLSTGTGAGGLPSITKVIPVGRDGSTSIVDSLFAQNSNTSNAVTVSAVSASGTQVSNSGHNLSSANVVLASPSTNPGVSNSGHLVHVQGPINMHPGNTATAIVGVGIPQTNLPPGTLTPSYFVEKNGNLSLVQGQQTRPITLEKRTADGKMIPSGSMILTTQHPHLQPGSGQTATVTIPLPPGVTFTHPLNATGQHSFPGSAQIISTPISAHHITSTVLSTISTPTISVSAQTTQPPLTGSNISTHAIPTHVISQSSNSLLSSVGPPGPSITVTSVASNSMPPSSLSIMPPNSISVSVSMTNATITSAPSTSTTCSSMNSNSLSTAAPAQSPNTKSTHSPRPSILRKQRGENPDNHVSVRAQRNLTLQLNFAGNSTNTAPIAIPTSAVSASIAAVSSVTSANKENAGAMERGPPVSNNSNNSCSNSNISSVIGLSILRKEFQPPNEESSWQSCSSHSSGSTTISATSETAEFQMNQPTSVADNLPLSCENLPPSNAVPSIPPVPVSQNGVVRSIPHGKGAHKSSSKLQNKNIERLKQDKDDGVSPRKKPRKQQLNSNDFLEAAPSEISFYQGRGKKLRRMENNIFDGYSTKSGVEAHSEDSTPQNLVCYMKKPRVSLLSSTQTQLTKTRLNHFEHYSEVKAKEERRPTISELANQKNILQRVDGWKMQHMTNQMDQVVELEVSVIDSFNSLLSRLENKVGPNCTDRDINRILELFKGNIQRCKVIRDQMSESRMQTLRILDHRPRIVEVITKHMTKKSGKKKDRL